MRFSKMDICDVWRFVHVRERVRGCFRRRLGTSRELSFLGRIRSSGRLGGRFVGFGGACTLLSFSSTTYKGGAAQSDCARFLYGVETGRVQRVSFCLFGCTTVVALLVVFTCRTNIGRRSRVLRRGVRGGLRMPTKRHVGLALRSKAAM